MQHFLCELHGPVDDERLVLNALLDAVHEAGAMIVGKLTHSFFPEGFTALLLLGESHAAVHTWPEERLARVDFFSCSPEPGFDEFAEMLNTRGFIVQNPRVIDR
jgi:S-adenosylmethionine decarboxylase